MELLGYADKKYKDFLINYHSFGKDFSRALGDNHGAKSHVFFIRLIGRAESKSGETGRPFFYEYHHMKRNASGYIVNSGGHG